MAKKIDLGGIASVLAAAHQDAQALPFRVEFEVDSDQATLTARGALGLDGGAWSNGSTTSRLLSDVFEEPDAAFAYMFSYLEASFRPK